jgi:hypothetical protein
MIIFAKLHKNSGFSSTENEDLRFVGYAARRRLSRNGLREKALRQFIQPL